jgi:hypothetical protein
MVLFQNNPCILVFFNVHKRIFARGAGERAKYIVKSPDYGFFCKIIAYSISVQVYYDVTKK